MRRVDRNLAGKATLLKCFNEENERVVWQPCCTCVGGASAARPNRHSSLSPAIAVGERGIVADFFIVRADVIRRVSSKNINILWRSLSC